MLIAALATKAGSLSSWYVRDGDPCTHPSFCMLSHSSRRRQVLGKLIFLDKDLGILDDEVCGRGILLVVAVCMWDVDGSSTASHGRSSLLSKLGLKS